ncbi:MAG: glycosyltransferase, partial [Solirubrobacterales bacterium]
MATLSLVIPAYNEEDRLPALLDVLATSAEADVSRAGFELLETLIVDDGSVDGTRRILMAAAQGSPRLQPVVGGERNRGTGAA